ncbi:hypothetical protein E2562_029190 [Oryza meyeriana var. granulata]|uniref:Uncharacterized protein n=1 Tax=Oryza meyeriana var. granulata TaxID=110450 RepID=A0A6G1C115_9ORYZ|nr:hypothetical protein E2562_029190 [Oryza meyeriana var. granulata]
MAGDTLSWRKEGACLVPQALAPLPKESHPRQTCMQIRLAWKEKKPTVLLPIPRTRAGTSLSEGDNGLNTKEGKGKMAGSTHGWPDRALSA